MSAELSTTTWPTRELILLEASRLFAVRGYRGTSTHDIAAAVGVRQPSLYKHFASKQEIAEELLRRDLTAGIDALERLATDGGGPAVELFRYLQWEVAYVRSTPFDLRALYLDELLDLPEFEQGRTMNARYSALLRSIIERGVQSEDFLPINVSFACQVVDAIVLLARRIAPEVVAVVQPRSITGISTDLRYQTKRSETARVGQAARASSAYKAPGLRGHDELAGAQL
jgi:AcrR family transcriptional regulator